LQLYAEFGVPVDVQSALPVGEWLGMRVDYIRDSAGYRNTVQEWAYAKVWDPWIYPHFPTAETMQQGVLMRRMLKDFEDWIPKPLPDGPAWPVPPRTLPVNGE
jgi:hypothetical protein